jgi:hypothetical protein
MKSKSQLALHQRIVRASLKLVRRYRKNFPYMVKRFLRRLRYTVPVLLTRSSRAGSLEKVVAITVSTNYADLLDLVIRANQSFFDHWIVVTQEGDTATRSLVESRDDMSIVFWNPTAHGRLFDKGSALRAAQSLAYQKFPDCWYLVLDSDIALPENFGRLQSQLRKLDNRKIYGAQRMEFGSYSDFLNQRNGVPYEASNAVFGYFQLYALPLKTKWSHDASRVDIDFRDLFFWREVLPDLTVSHFGVRTENWQGRKSVNEFVIDLPGETTE